MPDDLILICTEGDPSIPEYRANSRWPIEIVPADSRLGDIFNLTIKNHPEERFYGWLGDDMEPITPGWHKSVSDAAGLTKIAYPNDQRTFPAFRAIAALGGDLIRAMGQMAPGGIKHNYLDNLLETIGLTFDLMVPLKDVIVLHHHPFFDPSIPFDATYVRGSSDMDADRVRYEAWMASMDRVKMNARIRSMLEKKAA